MSICKQEAAFNGWSFCILIQSSQSDGIRSIESSEYLSSTQTFVHRKTAVPDTFFGTGRRSVYSGKYALSSLVFCAHCGDFYQRTQWVLKGEHVPVWRCVSRLQKKKLGIDCPSRTIIEADLHTAVVKAVNQLIEQKDELLPVFRANVEKALSASNSAAVAEVDAKLLAIQKELLKKADARQDFGDLADQIDALRDEKQRLLLEDANNTGLQQQLKTIEDFLAEQQEAVTEYEEALVRKLISKITVFDDKLVVEFKSGLETEVKM